ncbi:unnamed protein product [Cyprideis torosa]|uniref:U6 snRNA-associated Sm-like protein LSm8 n=1 Tax=Cyprideis torosa TaxID=163714 RepID=A0A7R8WMJ0_9CRUS|nr:unnamed protein product [Cyprideis torosa]CAG0899448.1 unnamed protein product [Cyprideis torosa]
MSAALDSYVNRLVSVITQDGRNIVGMLKGCDQTINIILDDSHERVYSNTQGVEQVKLGLYIIRGDNVAIIGEVDSETDKAMDLAKIKAEPLNPCICLKRFSKMADEVKRILVFGATGNTGLACLEQVLKLEKKVVAFVRDPEKIPASMKPQLASVVVGDVENQGDITRAFQENQPIDGVVVALGTRNNLDPTTMMSQALTWIVGELKKQPKQRLTVCLSAFLFWERSKLKPIFGPLTDEHERMLNILESIKDEQFHWVAISPPHIASEDPVGFGTYLVEEGAVPSGASRKISKYDLGDFLVRALWMKEYGHKHVGLAAPATG